MAIQEKQFNLPHRDSVTAMQINTLLQTAGMLMPYLLNPVRELENVPSGHKLDGEAAMAAQVTFINICDRLDKIVADSDRWELTAQRTLEATLTEVYQKNAELLKEQIIATKILNLPHNRYRPTLFKLTDGNIAAVLGSIDDLDNAIAAVGRSAAEALRAFDMLFNGEIPTDLFDWLKTREKAIEEGKTPPPMPKRKKKKTQ